MAVAAKQEGVDPVGCCVGLRGIRIQNIVSELNGEKIDVVAWSSDPATFIANALNPAQIVGVELNRPDGVATVVVPDRQLSLAIGKEGQNVRLAAKLTGWRIDIKSASVVEASRVTVEPVKPAEVVIPPVKEDAGAGLVKEPVTAVPITPATESERAKPATVSKPGIIPPTTEQVRLRFAEDILTTVKAEVKNKKKKKSGSGKETEEEIAARRQRRNADYSLDEDEEY